MALGRAIRISRATGAALGMLGAYWGGFAALIPDYAARAGLDHAGLGQVLLFSAVGGMGAMALGPRVGRALGVRAMPVTGALLAAAALMPLSITSGPSFALAVLVMGAAMSSLDIAANVRIADLEAREGLPLMNWNHAMFSFGFALAALAIGAARRAGGAPEVAQAGLALVLLLASVLLWERAEGWAITHQDAMGQGGAVPLGAAVWPAAAILFAAFVTENATETWSALHIERTFGAPPGSGAMGPAMLGLTMGLGRLGGQMLAARLGEARLVAISAGIGTLGAALVALAPTQSLAVIGVGLIGAGVAVTVPSANSLLGRRVAPAARARAISRAWMVGFTGFFLGPVAMGAIAQTAGLAAAFFAVALVMASVLPGLARLTRVPDDRALSQA